LYLGKARHGAVGEIQKELVKVGLGSERFAHPMRETEPEMGSQPMLEVPKQQQNNDKGCVKTVGTHCRREEPTGINAELVRLEPDN